MPQPRPVSPLTFETCADPPSDPSDDDLLASDDDLDEPAQAAKRQKIERIAESCRGGAPVFILSASLRGPFEHNWKNPWKKDRTRGGKATIAGKTKVGGDLENAPVIQETDPRDAKHRKDLSTASRKRMDVSSPCRSSVSALDKRPDRAASSSTKLNDKPQLPPRSTGRKSGGFRGDASVSVEDQTFTAPGTADWLRKGGKRLNFGKFEPPSSPTPKADLRRARYKSSSVSHAIGKQDTRSPARTRSPTTPRVSEKPHVECAPPTSLPPALPSSRTKCSVSTITKQDGQKASDTTKNHAALSFRVASSTSQLPRFQYQRWNAEDSSPGDLSNLPVENPADKAPSVPTAEDPEDDTTPLDVPLEQENVIGKAFLQTDRQVEPSKDIQVANQEGTESTNAGTFGQTSIEQNTYEQLPSAQQVPVVPGVSDRVTSLHSTAVPKENNTASVGSYDTQLSTQAALRHAQKSFQDDLESSEPDYDIPSEKEDGNGDESLLAHETPFLNPDISDRIMPSNFSRWDKEKVQAMSTQCMIDAATPFTFSTGKKPNQFRDLSPVVGTSPGITGMAAAFSPARSSPSAVDDFHTAPTNEDQDAPGQQQPGLALGQQSTTQNSALPFALTG